MSEPLPKLLELGLIGFIVDLDGVVTHTASVHATAWKTLFDEYLKSVAEKRGEPFVPFDIDADYVGHVDGKPRYNGVRDFLASRGITLEWGDVSDPSDRETVCGLGNRKNDLFVETIKTRGADTFPSTITLLKTMKANGVRLGVVTSSRNCDLVLGSVGLTDLFEVQVDGIYAADNGLPGKPAPDTFVRACDLMGISPADCAAVEDAVVGVQACRAGGFKLVIGVNRGVGQQALLDGGADVVVDDLGEFDLG